jgi:hypothetical protein
MTNLPREADELYQKLRAEPWIQPWLDSLHLEFMLSCPYKRKSCNDKYFLFNWFSLSYKMASTKCARQIRSLFQVNIQRNQ